MRVRYGMDGIVSMFGRTTHNSATFDEGGVGKERLKTRLDKMGSNAPVKWICI